MKLITKQREVLIVVLWVALVLAASSCAVTEPPRAVRVIETKPGKALAESFANPQRRYVVEGRYSVGDTVYVKLTTKIWRSK